MASLSTSFAGLSLKNPLVMASAPPTETVENIVRCAEAGAAAVVTKTIAHFDEREFTMGARRARLDKSGLWAMSTFRRETLTLDAGIALVSGGRRSAGIPIIASVGALDMEPESWLPTCAALCDAGASLLHLDLFYLPHPRCAPESVRKLQQLLKTLGAELTVPIAPKLNVELPAHYAAEILKDMPIAAAFAIDSIRVPPPLELSMRPRSRIPHSGRAGECSLFGAWQKPITLQYIRVLAERLSVPLCAGGGLMNGRDALEAIVLGASTVQFATAIIERGFKEIGVILKSLECCLDEGGFADIESARGVALAEFATDEAQLGFGDVKAQVDHDLCIMCGKCTSQVFCSDIRVVDNRIEVRESCDGCGLCVDVCPTIPKALTAVSAETWKANGTSRAGR